MTILRLNEIRSQAARALELYSERAGSWGARLSILGTGPIAYTLPTAYYIADRRPYGHRPVYEPMVERALKPRAKGPRAFKTSIHAQQLPLVTTTEHAWLLKNGFPGIARWTRVDPHADYWLDHSPFVESKRSTIREIWVGARSMKTLSAASRQFLALPEEVDDDQDDQDEDREEDANLERESEPGFLASDDTAEGHSASALEQEDAAELTDLMTMTYQGMIEDPETGELRRIRIGDIVTVAWGSNEDLDALYLEEGDDPRRQNDAGAYGSDHMWSDRFRSTTRLEDNFKEYRGNWVYRGTKIVPKPVPERDRYKAPNTMLQSNGLAWAPDELTLRRIAQLAAARLVERNPALEPQLQGLTDEAERKLRAMAAKVRYAPDEGLVEGYFVTRDEFFGTLDSLQRQWDQAQARVEVFERKFEGDERPRRFTRSKTPPAPVDWDRLRTPAEKRERKKILSA